jgi:hypothetical protein
VELVGWSEWYTVNAPNLVKVVTAILVAEDDPGICDLLTDLFVSVRELSESLESVSIGGLNPLTLL